MESSPPQFARELLAAGVGSRCGIANYLPARCPALFAVQSHECFAVAGGHGFCRNGACSHSLHCLQALG